MDFQHRAGGKTGGGGVASFSEANRDRRERLRQLALETIDLNKVSFRSTLQNATCKLGRHEAGKNEVVIQLYIYVIHLFAGSVFHEKSSRFI